MFILCWTFGFTPYLRKEKLNVECFCEIVLIIIIMILPWFEYIENPTIYFYLGWVVNGIVIAANILLVIYCVGY
jgi:hypothetical protein